MLPLLIPVWGTCMFIDWLFEDEDPDSGENKDATPKSNLIQEMKQESRKQGFEDYDSIIDQEMKNAPEGLDREDLEDIHEKFEQNNYHTPNRATQKRLKG